jgi:hypothetical protein
MRHIVCRHCNNPVWSTSRVCSHCGGVIRVANPAVVFAGGAWLVFALLVLIGSLL